MKYMEMLLTQERGNKMKKLLLIPVFSLLCSGCVTDHGHFTVISKDLVDLDNLDIQNAPKIKNVKGDSTGYIITLFPAGTMNPNPEDAMKNALRQVDGDLFVNTQITSSFFWIPYVFGEIKLSVEGDVIKTIK